MTPRQRSEAAAWYRSLRDRASVLYRPADGTGPFVGEFCGVTRSGRLRVQMPGRLAITTPDRLTAIQAADETATILRAEAR